MKKEKSRNSVKVQDLNRPCYNCEIDSKIMTVADGKIGTVVDEYCLVCDREFIEKLIRSVLGSKRRFKLELRNQEKKQKFLALVELILKERSKGQS